MGKLFEKLNGWKSVLGYLLMSMPWLTPYPMLKAAIDAVLANPSKEAWTNMVVQLILAVGIVDRVRKNLKGKK